KYCTTRCKIYIIGLSAELVFLDNGSWPLTNVFVSSMYLTMAMMSRCGAHGLMTYQTAGMRFIPRGR
ncbi:MAG TPA: hypothetical protein VK462_09110, partial [Nitrososphaeraceae archaeon]|nr:hypothetical protein [Nitrososphaeraceae archaeon]